VSQRGARHQNENKNEAVENPTINTMAFCYLGLYLTHSICIKFGFFFY
jgi:hypothetical protein